MDWVWIIIGLAAVIAIGAGIFWCNSNYNYTAGSGMFKNSKYNLNDDKKDISDVEYYNKKDKLK